MNFYKNLQKYARLIVKAGINIQKGQELVINANINCVELVRLVTEEAYKAGAKEVIVRFTDERISRLKYDYCDISVFENIPSWYSEFNNSYARQNAGFLSILSEDPDAFKGIDARKPAAWVKNANAACKEYRNNLDMGINTWCIVAMPSPKWASKVFPNHTEDVAISMLWDAIFKAVRVDTPNPVEAWKQHKKTFAQKTQYLNNMQFTSLHYKNSLGTDFIVGLPENHIWAGGGDKTQSGTYFFPNMPTEEIFCSPDKNKASGTVFSALPLIYQGNTISDFSITFENGRICDFSAKEGFDTLKELINTDEGSHHLGEVALIPKSSPLSQMGILFYNTLFDENASCHLAIGKGFPECIENGLNSTKEELAQKGMNDSATHVDFMIGTDDLNIYGITPSGEEINIFINGEWA